MLVGHNWLFLKDGLDDFRDGLPPPNIGDPVIKVNIDTSQTTAGTRPQKQTRALGKSSDQNLSRY